MEVQQLRHLLAAVQYGNLVRAAEECYISQSGLSRSIKSLETRLGVPLLIRSASGVEPTVYGQSILKRARVVLNEVGKSMREIKEIQAGRSGLITVGMTSNFAASLMPSVIAKFATGDWNIHVNAVVASFPILVEKVKTGEVDFGIGLLAAMETVGDLKIEEICDSHARVVARPSHPMANQADISPQELAQARWAMLDSDSLQRKFNSYFQQVGDVIPERVLGTNSVMLLKKVMSLMDVLTVLPVDMVRDEILRGDLVAIDAEPPAEYARAGLLIRRESYVTPAMQSVMDEIRRRVAETNDQDVLTFIPPAGRPTGPESAVG